MRYGGFKVSKFGFNRETTGTLLSAFRIFTDVCGTRMAIGAMNRTPRVFPHDDVEVCGWTVPRGVSIPYVHLKAMGAAQENC